MPLNINTSEYLFVITPTTNIEDLSSQKKYFESLPYDQRRLSNDACLAKYHLTNDQLFDILFDTHDELSGDEESIRHMDDSINEAFVMQTNTVDQFKERVSMAELSEKTNGITLIYPYSIENEYVYSMEELNTRYQKYQDLSSSLKDIADQESLRIFGNDVKNMYAINKIKVLIKDETDGIETFDKTEIEKYRDSVQIESDHLALCLHKLDLINIKEHGSILESTIAEDLKDITVSTIDDLSMNIPPLVPYFTPEEIDDFVGNSSEFLNEYKRACSRGLCEFDYSSVYGTVKDLYKEFKKTNDSEIPAKMIALGWNPSVVPCVENMKFAHNRIKKYIDENYKMDIIDLTRCSVHEDIDVELVNNDLQPIFIILSYTNTKLGRIINKVKHSNYSHAAISFESSLEHLYSFNMKPGKTSGISYESIKQYRKVYEDAKIKVLTLFVTQNQKARIHAKLDYFIANESKTKYDIRNLFRILFNKQHGDSYSLKMVCSQFVDSLLRAVNIDITGKSNNLVSPSDFEKVKDTKVYIVYEGLIKDYKPKTTDIIVRAISLNRSSVYKMVELTESIKPIFQFRDPILFKSIRFTNEEANVILDEINDILTPGSILTEAKKFPFKISSNGDVEINFPTIIENEYQQSHKLLLEYDKTNNITGMKDELAKLWYLNNIAERKIKGVKINKSEVIKTRARILNDFKKYIKVIIASEPDFNFTEYFNQSEYYDKSITIDGTTLKWSGKILKNLIKPI